MSYRLEWIITVNWQRQRRVSNKKWCCLEGTGASFRASRPAPAGNLMFEPCHPYFTRIDLGSNLITDVLSATRTVKWLGEQLEPIGTKRPHSTSPPERLSATPLCSPRNDCQAEREYA